MPTIGASTRITPGSTGGAGGRGGGRLLLDLDGRAAAPRRGLRPARPCAARSRGGRRPRSSPRRRPTPGRSGRSRGSARRASRRRRRPRATRWLPRPRIVSQERLRVLAEEREQEQLLLARREPGVALAELVEVGLVRRAPRRRRPARPPAERSRRSRRAACRSAPRAGRAARRRRSGSARRRARAGAPARRAPGRSAPRAAASRPRRGSASSSSITSSSRSPGECARRWTSSAAIRPAGRLCSAARVAIRGGERRHRLVADVLVDEVGGPPERVDVDAGRQAEAVERVGDRLAGRAVEDERDRVDRGGDQVGAGPGGLDRGRERGAAGALAVEADRQPACVADRLDELAHAVRLERAGRVVEEHARGAELGQPPRLGDERVGLAGRARGCRRGRRP